MRVEGAAEQHGGWRVEQNSMAIGWRRKNIMGGGGGSKSAWWVEEGANQHGGWKREQTSTEGGGGEQISMQIRMSVNSSPHGCTGPGGQV